MSDKPLAERLQVKGDRQFAVVNAPAGLQRVLGVHACRAEVCEADIVVLFVADRASFDLRVPELLRSLRHSTILWIAYPKLTSSFAHDLNRDVLREAAPGFGLDTVSQIAIDADWSALRMKRLPAPPP